MNRENGRRYQEFQHGTKTIYVEVSEPGENQPTNSIKHLLIVEDGKTEVLTSWEQKIVTDVIGLTEKSIGERE